MEATVSAGDLGKEVNDSSGTTTAAMLEQRLHRLEFLLHGRSSASGVAEPAGVLATPDESVWARVARIEKGLHWLTSQHGFLRGILDLHTRYPDLFTPLAEEQIPSTLDNSVIQSMVLAHASTYSEVVARLNLVKELPIPPATVSAGLAELQPRLDRAREAQEVQLDRVAALRVRTARLLEWWLEAGVVGQGEVWVELEERVRAAERGLRRLEAARAKEKQGL